MSEVQDINKKTNNISSAKQDDTELSTNSFFYTWTLRNILECTKFPEPRVLSPVFEFAGAKWRLWLQTICDNDKLDKVKIRLIQDEQCNSGHYIKYKFSLLNADGSLVANEAASLFGDNHLGHRLLFKNENDKSSFIINGTVIVNCELIVLSSSVITSNDQINQSDNEVQRSAKEVMMNYPIRGTILSILRSQTPKLASKLKGLNMCSSARNTFMHSVFRSELFLTLYTISIALVLSFLFSQGIKLYMPVMNEKLNMTEVNELIIDSTLKIQKIAEAMNLTTIKIKSSDLLAWYHKNYNTNFRNFADSREGFLNFDAPIVNVSSNMSENKTSYFNGYGSDNEH